MIYEIIINTLFIIILSAVAYKFWKHGDGIMDFFREESGKLSLMRLMSVGCFVMLCWVIVTIMQTTKTFTVEPMADLRIYVIGLLTLGAFFPKLLQKFIEQYTNGNKKNNLPKDK